MAEYVATPHPHPLGELTVSSEAKGTSIVCRVLLVERYVADDGQTMCRILDRSPVLDQAGEAIAAALNATD